MTWYRGVILSVRSLRHLVIYTGMDITCLYTSFYDFICASGWVAVPRQAGRNYVPLFGVQTA